MVKLTVKNLSKNYKDKSGKGLSALKLKGRVAYIIKESMRNFRLAMIQLILQATIGLMTYIVIIM
jgi:hypothetical protein